MPLNWTEKEKEGKPAGRRRGRTATSRCRGAHARLGTSMVVPVVHIAGHGRPRLDATLSDLKQAQWLLVLYADAHSAKTEPELESVGTVRVVLGVGSRVEIAMAIRGQERCRITSAVASCWIDAEAPWAGLQRGLEPWVPLEPYPWHRRAAGPVVVVEAVVAPSCYCNPDWGASALA